MGRTLFIGCSHSIGYHELLINKGNNVWQKNNYAEIYAQKNNKKSIIMASAGMGNREIVNFLSHAFKTYSDIEEVYIQSTYWGRFPIAINPSLAETDIFPLDFFTEKAECDNLIDRWTIGQCQPDIYSGKWLQDYFKPEAYDYDNMPYIKNTTPTLQPNLRTSSYMYVKMYHYLQTHLEQQDYMKDIAFCDMLCNINNANMYLWNINSRCFIPKEVNNFYTKLKKTTIADVDALNFLKQFSSKDLEEEKVDDEHYNEYVHKLIADYYIPFLKEQNIE